MSGHSKWKQIKHKKAATDTKKSKVFSKLAQLISMEAKKCGGDVNSPGLRMAISKARAENMPSDNIDRAVKKASEQKETYENIMYEGYGHGGVGIIVEVLTSNRNKASQEIKHIFSKHGGNLGAMGSVSWGFTKTEEGWEPNMTIPLSDEDADKLSPLIDALEENEEVHEVYTNAD